MAENARKRKQPSNTGPSNNPKRARFPQRPQHVIPATPTSNAYPNGEINVKNFLKSHEHEIKSLEGAMKAAKNGLTRRAFQDVPRALRRRTASHNPHRVPKRLRVRARQEAKDDNTPISRGTSGSGIGKGKKKYLRKEGRERSRQDWEKRTKTRKGGTVATPEKDQDGDATMEDVPKEATKSVSQSKPKRKFPALATPATPPSRFRRRQRDKTWLPTHLWHTKRAKMTDPKEPLWGFAVPLQPAAKAYRLTHRAVTQQGAVAWDMSYMSTVSLEGPDASIAGLLKGLHFGADDPENPWQNRGRAKKWRRGARAWEGWIHEREAKPLRKIGRVTVIWCVSEAESKRKVFVRVHPSAFLQLWNEVVRTAKVQKPAVTVQDLRFEIGSIEIMGPATAEALCSVLQPTSNPAAIADAPHSLWTKLASVTDAGSLPAGALLAFDTTDPRLRDPPSATPLAQDQQSLTALAETLANWPIDNTQGPAAIFDANARLAAQRAMPSQKSINRRKSACTLGEDPEARSTDPHIPTLVFTSRKSRSWTILLPWKCVMPVWRQLMRYPVSTGGNPRYGGLKERRQVDFERSIPYFPYDCPGTDAGWGWELHEREVRKLEWTKRPRGKRIEWTTIDLGNGRKGEVGDPWACDWERLLPTTDGSSSAVQEGLTPFRQLPSSQAKDVIDGRFPVESTPLSSSVFAVKITMVQRGAPMDCTRIYRLPTDAGLRSKWLSLMPQPGARRTPALEPSRRLGVPPKLSEGPPKAGEDDYPVVPDESDLIGFVTTGNYNLAEGMPTAVGNLAVHKVLSLVSEPSAAHADHVCIRQRPSLHDPRPASPRVSRESDMSEDRPADDQGEGVDSAVGLPSDVLAELTTDILDDLLSNIVYSTALSCHRSEKLLRMQSAATQAESIALANLEPQSQKQNTNGATSIPIAETSAAKYENGRVFLKGNPLKTTPEIICPHCKLPRLMHPIMGKGMQNPDLTKEYCMLYPWVQRSGHDVYGNPFPTDMAKSKKERELIKQQQKNAEKESVGTPGSQDTDMAGGDTKEIKLNTGGKPASYIPWHTCPNCKRSLLITRFAQHLEKCLGISGRQSSRNAMAKLTGQNGTGSGVGNTPLGSRMGTPAPGSQDVAGPKSSSKSKGISPTKKVAPGDDADADELGMDNDTPERRNKIKKKSSYVKKADRDKSGNATNGTLKVKLKTRPELDRKHSENSERSEGKRDREADEGGDSPKKKKIKLSLGGNGKERSRASASVEPASAASPE
ncbi:ribonuclease p complex subunit pop1 [Stemphylium lycopersici]|uniref:SAGA-associated factor 11 n=1 Tax=Stemphylium lycopersici TaxID=183478 RepID=A0A364N1Q2_STELY|nr:ribonuclease p complex subunit pop1 [Stemphylium lycopersici]RAR09458.1 ribonuclease p complex subunit pop1 [Stemphylium lycopersici]